MSKTSNRKSDFAKANKILQIRATQGDVRAREVLCHRIAVRQMHTGKAKGLAAKYHLCELSEDIHLHFRRDRQTRGHIKMFLEIGDHTSLDAIRTQWTAIRTWRELLLSWQGPWRAEGYSELQSIVHALQKRRKSYSSIAQHLNDAVANDLRSYIQNDLTFQLAVKTGMIKNHQDLVLWWQRTSDNVWELASAKTLLRDMGFPGDEVEKWCTYAFENLLEGREAFPPGVPITCERVLSQLRTWRAKYRTWLANMNK